MELLFCFDILCYQTPWLLRHSIGNQSPPFFALFTHATTCATPHPSGRTTASAAYAGLHLPYWPAISNAFLFYAWQARGGNPNFRITFRTAQCPATEAQQPPTLAGNSPLRPPSKQLLDDSTHHGKPSKKYREKTSIVH